MNKSQKLILAELLELAGEEFSNHGCNDYELPSTPENLELERQMLNHMGLAECQLNISEDKKTIYSGDHMLMYYFAKLLKDEAQAGGSEGGDSLLEEKQ